MTFLLIVENRDPATRNSHNLVAQQVDVDAAVEARLPHTAFYAKLPLETAEDAAEAAAIRAGYKNEERLDCNKLVCYCGKRIGVGVVTDCSCLLHSGD